MSLSKITRFIMKGFFWKIICRYKMNKYMKDIWTDVYRQFSIIIPTTRLWIKPGGMFPSVCCSVLLLLMDK